MTAKWILRAFLLGHVIPFSSYRVTLYVIILIGVLSAGAIQRDLSQNVADPDYLLF